ncbi:hypothetical protein CCACVL1_24507 [Corchorus capsularis]|uniref:Uncharacterized protein n=1 Tax=Corchorus capsularis TaxID=210143 RepID=A0A1R3GPC2_COCAP|nr:hypothetical protein CCACVL1_24507 [Corchorus capsularis]
MQQEIGVSTRPQRIKRRSTLLEGFETDQSSSDQRTHLVDPLVAPPPSYQRRTKCPCRIHRSSIELPPTKMFAPMINPIASGAIAPKINPIVKLLIVVAVKLLIAVGSVIRGTSGSRGGRSRHHRR